MSNFNFSATNNTLTVTFFLNLAKREDNRETVVGFCHNGMLLASPKNDSSWVQFSVNSDKQGWVPMELTFQGQTKKVNPEQFWTKLFGCESVDEVPNVKVKASLGDIDNAEEMYSQGGCLAITIDIADINILGEQDYKDETSLYLRVNPIALELRAYYGTKIDAAWVTSCLQESIIDSNKANSASLGKYKRSTKKAAKRAQSQELKALEESAPSLEEDALMDL